MSMKFALAAGAIAFAAMTGASNAQVQTQRDITWKLGLAIAEGAIEECAKNNVNITVAVLDRAGRMRVFIASNDPSPHNFELARRKAYTARTFRRPSLQWAQQTREGADLAGQRQLADVIPLGGGVPTINLRIDYLRPAVGGSLTGTARVRRAGRWKGRGKVECGIHVVGVRAPPALVAASTTPERA